jgi:transcriptional regulator with XRE-family HTH domain
VSALSLRIRKARATAGLSQAELALRVGVKRSAVTQWEHPTGTKPSVDHMIQIALETGVAFEWLATGRGPTRANAAEPVPPVILDDFARDEHESQALVYLRHFSPSKRRMALEILAVLSK